MTEASALSSASGLRLCFHQPRLQSPASSSTTSINKRLQTTMSTVRIPAGRSYRRPNTKFVDASPEKGIIEVIPDSGMVSLVWRNKETDRAEDELLIFPGEAVFERVKQDPSGRSWVLRFVESKQTHFVSAGRAWLEQASAA